MTDDGSLDLFDDLDGSGENTDGSANPAEPRPLAPEPAEPEPAEPKVWSVSQVNRAVRGLLESSVEPLWVGGEVANWTRSRAGHCYFTLKDDRAQLKSVMFAREADRLPTDPGEGSEIRAYGDLTLYEARGDYQMVVRRLEADGADGLWRKAFEELRARLNAEGLLEPDLKRPVPRYPRTVGVVTSPTGAAFRDVLSVLTRRAPWVRVVLRGSRVQGEGAASEIADAIRRLDESGLVDVIIVGRGGGSLEDLWAFNEEPVARAIATCSTPVVSAVGHEIDITISDLIADLRAPTPSAAAESVVPDRVALLAHLRRAPERLGRGVRRAGSRRRDAVAERLAGLTRAIERRLTPLDRAVELGGDRLERRMVELSRSRRSALQGLSGRLEALSPLGTLSRGYSVARGPDGRVLRRVDGLAAGVRFRLRVTDGTVEAESLGEVDDTP